MAAWETVKVVRCKNCVYWTADPDYAYGEDGGRDWGTCSDYGGQPDNHYCKQGIPRDEVIEAEQAEQEAQSEQEAKRELLGDISDKLYQIAIELRVHNELALKVVAQTKEHADRLFDEYRQTVMKEVELGRGAKV